MALTRPLAIVAAVALVALALLALLPDCAHACSCSSGGAPFRVIAKGTDASAVFSGEVLNVQEGDRVTLSVSEVWKGPEQETLEVRTRIDPVLCGYPFKEGQEYLVYAYGKEEPFNTDLCSETRLLSKAGAHLRVLGDGWSSGNDSALSDTSGGFPRLDVVGMLGLAVAAVSLVFLIRLVRIR